MSDHTTKMGTDHCPVCNYLADSAAPVDDKPATPMPGDLSICINCGAFLQFAPDMDLIELTPKEWDKLDNQTKETLAKAHRLIRRRGPLKPAT